MSSDILSTVRQLADVATPLKFEALNAQLAAISTQLGFPVDQLRAALCLFAAYPLAMLLRQLPSPTAKHWMNICVGVAMAQLVYGAEWLHSLASAAITYALVQCAPIAYAPTIVFVFNMAYVAALHVYRMHVDYMGWTMDCTASQMLLLIKLTSFAYNYYDGHCGAWDPTATAATSQAAQRVQQTRARLALTTLPSLLEYFGFVYGFTTFIAGPAFEIREYLDAVDGTTTWQQQPLQTQANGQANGPVANKANSSFVQHERPSCALAAFKKFATGVFFMALLAVYGTHANVAAVLAAPHEPLTVKTGRLLLALFLTRGKYYAAWKLAEGATIVAGAGFEGFDAATGAAIGWNGVSNIDIVGFECGESIRDLARAWNKGTQTWLERYVYSRTGNSLLATYLCSAVWHGFYPGYYLFFLTIPLATAVNRLARKHIRPHFIDCGSACKRLYDALGMLGTALVINYLAVSFVVLSWDQSLAGFQSMHFVGHIGLIVAYVVLSLLPSKRTPKEL